MSAWSHLPNAAHIDRVIESSNSYPEVWNVAYDSARNAAYDSAYTAARNAAWNAVLAFIAYDDAANYLAMPSDQLKAWAILSKNPAAILLLPVVIAYERISEWELA
jgi:hypothetical protein